MKTTISTLLLCLLNLSIYAQLAEDFPTTFDKASGKITLPPAIRLLEDGKKYFVKFPEKLSFHTKAYDVESISSALLRLKIEPNWTRKPADADYTIRLSSPGISVTPSAPVYITENRPATYFATAATIKGYVYNLRYHFPVTAELLNKAGEVEKTFLFNTDSATWVYHSNFLLDAMTTEDAKPTKLTLPFATEQAAADNFKKNTEAIYKRMEYNTWFFTMDYIKKILEIAYNNYKIDEDNFYGKVFMKKGKAQYPALTEAIEKQQDLIGDLDDEKKQAAAMEELKKNQLYFDALADSLSAYGPKFQTVVLSHAAWGALLTGQREKAASHFTSYYLVENDEYNMFGPFKKVFAVYHLHDLLKQSGQAAEPDEDIAYLTPEKTAAPGLDPALINITRQDGEVEKTNGEKITGKISIEYMAKSSGIVDMDLGKSATVYFMKNGGETYQFAKVNNTK